MHAIAAPLVPRATSRLPSRPPRPSPRQVVVAIVVILLVAALSGASSTFAYLELPAPSGSFAVGRADVLVVDPHRAETRSTSGDRRAVRLVAWYPAVAATGLPAEYVPNYARIRAGLQASGELSAPVVAGLGLVRTQARAGAAMASDGIANPVVLLSPGNATNVAFYGSLAEDLASHGYVVIGIDHPFQVAAVDLGADVATYAGDDVGGPAEEAVRARIEERVADIGFVLDRILEDAAGFAALHGRLDLARIGIVGHSNGGIAAAETCAADERVAACMNIDGQAAGGPFSVLPDPAPPTRPFMFLTKEKHLHPALAERFESGTNTYRVVVPAATHQSFTDGPRFEPRLMPFDGTADQVLQVERGFTRAFFDHTLRDAPESTFGELTVGTDVFVEVYPLGRRPNLPVDASRG